MNAAAIHYTKKAVLACALGLVLVTPPAHALDDPGLERVVAGYANNYRSLDMAPLDLSYVANLQNIRGAESRTRQLEFFQALATQLQDVDQSGLTVEDQYVYRHLDYIIAINLQRIGLENAYMQTNAQGPISTQGLFNVPMGQEWYRYFVRRMLTEEITPEQLVEFGTREIAKVQQQIKEVQAVTGYADDEAGFYEYLNDERFLLRSQPEITARYRERENIVKPNLGKLFLEADAPAIAIRPYAISDKDTPPGSVVITPPEIAFQYNFFQEQHNTRAMDFIFLHEALPGHAYQYQYFMTSDFENNIPSAPGYYAVLGEGWAAYCEELGHELGLYQSPYDFLGKLEFDLVRSVRMVMDVGLNYYGWNNQQALEFWHANIKGQDAIAQREIDRMLRWPVQVLTYKVGADKIIELKSLAQDRLKDDFDVREFHHQILGYGVVPLFLLETRVNDYIADKLEG